MDWIKIFGWTTVIAFVAWYTSQLLEMSAQGVGYSIITVVVLLVMFSFWFK